MSLEIKTNILKLFFSDKKFCLSFSDLNSSLFVARLWALSSLALARHHKIIQLLKYRCMHKYFFHMLLLNSSDVHICFLVSYFHMVCFLLLSLYNLDFCDCKYFFRSINILEIINCLEKVKTGVLQSHIGTRSQHYQL